MRNIAILMLKAYIYIIVSLQYFIFASLPLRVDKLYVFMKMAAFRVITPCSLAEVHQRFRSPCCHSHGDNTALQHRRRSSSCSPREPQILLTCIYTNVPLNCRGLLPFSYQPIPNSCYRPQTKVASTTFPPGCQHLPYLKYE
jgi:hypothetical protein